MRLVYVVIDGMGDLPIEELGGRTPLEAAETPNMDALAKRGRLGLMYSVAKGIAPESDVAVISILGYDPFRYETGRGPLEALGSGLTVKDGDLALRCNFATLAPDGRILDRRAGRDLTAEEAKRLAEAVNREVKLRVHPADFEFRATIGHRGALVIRSREGPLSGDITNTDPAYKKMEGVGVVDPNAAMVLQECRPLRPTEAATVSAQLVNEFVEWSRRVLEEHEVNRRRAALGKPKANVVLTRDAGDRLPKLFNLGERYGLRFAALADMPVERAISQLAGMDSVELPPPSGNLAADCKLRAEKLLALWGLYDAFYLHIKGPDEPGHDGNHALKTQMIAMIDEAFFGNLLPSVKPEECLICVTADHSTPCKLKAHSDDPVPVLVSGGYIRPDGAGAFSEKECSRGSLGTLKHGTELMPKLVSFLEMR
ncbi:MAG: alkaline phosphatase family protein [Candidatus Bathyarchaeia archaeon]